MVFWDGEAQQDPLRSYLMLPQMSIIELANRLPELLLMPWCPVGPGASCTHWIFKDGVAA